MFYFHSPRINGRLLVYPIPLSPTLAILATLRDPRERGVSWLEPVAMQMLQSRSDMGSHPNCCDHRYEDAPGDRRQCMDCGDFL
jgi:hypothetical protein